MIVFNFDFSSAKRLFKRMKTPDKKRIHEGMGYIIEIEVVKQVNEMDLIDTGLFKSSINHDVVDSTKVLIQDGVFYGKYLEYGTRSHNTLIDEEVRKTLSGGMREYAPFRKGAINSIPKVTEYVLSELIAGAKR